MIREDRACFMMASLHEASDLAGTNEEIDHEIECPPQGRGLLQFFLATSCKASHANYPEHGIYGLCLQEGEHGEWFDTEQEYTQAIGEATKEALTEWPKVYQALEQEKQRCEAEVENFQIDLSRLRQAINLIKIL